VILYAWVLEKAVGHVSFGRFTYCSDGWPGKCEPYQTRSYAIRYLLVLRACANRDAVIRRLATRQVIKRPSYGPLSIP
jgi:hypothetical protein